MHLRRRMAAGLLLAVMASGTAVTSASAAQLLKSGPKERTASAEECSARATVWTEQTRIFRYCRYRDSSDGLKAGWWVWEY